MEIKDPIHGTLRIHQDDYDVVKNPFFQRLRRIKQLGPAETTFPGATHTRFIHSLGVMHLGQRVFKHLFHNERPSKDLIRLEKTLTLACLLHDIGHAPLGHTTEKAMPKLYKLDPHKKLYGKVSPLIQASHEDYTVKAIVDGPLTDTLKKHQKTLGVSPLMVASLILGKDIDPHYFSYKGNNLFPLLNQLVSSELDCDRMDYLLRDSYFCGVPYGKYDLDWLISNFKIHIEKKKAYLALPRKAVMSFDDFLLGRYHMFLMVYFHHRSICLEQLLFRYFRSKTCEYSIPASMDEYLKHDDEYLKNVLRQSHSPDAKRFITGDIPPRIFESFGKYDYPVFKEVEHFLKEKDVNYLKTSSKHRLSKYYSPSSKKKSHQEGSFPIKILIPNYLENGKSFSPKGRNIHDVTSLFENYSRTHSIHRIYSDLKELNTKEKKQLALMMKGL